MSFWGTRLIPHRDIKKTPFSKGYLLKSFSGIPLRFVLLWALIVLKDFILRNWWVQNHFIYAWALQLGIMIDMSTPTPLAAFPSQWMKHGSLLTKGTSKNIKVFILFRFTEFEKMLPFCKNISVFVYRSRQSDESIEMWVRRDGSRGRVQGVRTPPPPRWPAVF